MDACDGTLSTSILHLHSNPMLVNISDTIRFSCSGSVSRECVHVSDELVYYREASYTSQL